MKSYFNDETIQKMLKYAALYNIVWGVFFVFFPNVIFNILAIPVPNYIELWQCFGLVLGLFGIGYFIASFSPITHWLIVFVGFLCNVFGAILFLKAYIFGSLPLNFFSLVLLIDVLWILPFYYFLLYAYEANTLEEPAKAKLSTNCLKKKMYSWFLSVILAALFVVKPSLRLRN
jgi:small multidrug resistance pump